MFNIPYSIRVFGLIVILFFFACQNNSQAKQKAPKTQQPEDFALFNLFMDVHFNAHSSIPDSFSLTKYNEQFYKWSYTNKSRIKMEVNETPDSKEKVFIDQYEQIHFIFAVLPSANASLPTQLDSLNIEVWSNRTSLDSLLIDWDNTTYQNQQLNGYWKLNNTILGGIIKGKVFDTKETKKLLVYYLIKSKAYDKTKLITLGNKILNKIEFYTD